MPFPWRKTLQIIGLVIAMPGLLAAMALLADLLLPNLISDVADLAGMTVRPDSLWFAAAVGALIFGLVLIRVSGRPPEMPAGVFVILAFLSLIFALLAPLVAMPGKPHKIASCASHQRQLVLTAFMYAQEHDERMPSSEEFWRVAATLSDDIFVCPATRRYFHALGGYGINAFAAGRPLGEVAAPADTLFTADSVQPKMMMASDRDISLRHNGGCVASFLDGHVGWLSRERASQIRWRLAETRLREQQR